MRAWRQNLPCNFLADLATLFGIAPISAYVTMYYEALG